MNYSQDFLSKKLEAIRACQADPNFRPAPTKGELARREQEAIKNQSRLRRQEELIRAKEEKRQARLKEKEELKRAKEADRVKKSMEQKARDIMKAKRVQRLSDEQLTDPVNQGYIKTTRSTSQRALPLRPGGPDLTGKKCVQVDSKTWIYVDPDADVQAAIDKVKYRHGLKDQPATRDAFTPKYQF